MRRRARTEGYRLRRTDARGPPRARESGCTSVRTAADLEGSYVPISGSAARDTGLDPRAGLAAILAGYLEERPEGNALVSPLSLSLILALLAPGATDPTRQGFDTLLGAGGEDRNRTWSAIQTSVNRNDGDLEGFDPEEIPEEPLVHLANHVVIREGVEVSQDYLDTVLRWLDAQIEQVSARGMKDNLDAWAEHNTGGLIPSSGINPTQDTVLVLQNALLFAARWSAPFAAEDTSARSFTRADGSTVQAELMHATLQLVHVEGQGWSAVRLDYAGGQADTGEGRALDVVLPEAGTSPAQLDPATRAAASAALDEASRAGNSVEVELALPNLDLASPATSLIDALAAQGLDPVGFEGIAPSVVLTDVLQQVRLLIDEEGTVAAALTEAMETTSGAPPSETVPFIVDRPYVLRLQDLACGATLLEAAIMDPTAS
ncbi:MAG: serpin family protein [Actinomyces sp.]|uniref:serpin family protein n=1 Tax=Actinomyces sp. TaxID=29317 RepID=UPI0026DBB4BC|nr:serpin family protein [Actinomyces sp.]MDO4244007.1 serpin family protein [Actinomyces sp.]